jgi:chromate transporter
MVALMAMSAIYVTWGESTIVTALFAGLTPAVLAIVAHAVLRVSRRAFGSPALLGLGVAAFIALSVFAVPFPIVLAAAAAAGLGLGRWAPSTMRVAEVGEASDSEPPLIADDALHSEHPSWGHAAKVLSIGLLAWGVPIAAFVILTGTQSVFTQQGVFFSGATVVTFGGAYAVLAYGGVQAFDGARPDDGRLELGVVTAKNAVQWTRTLTRVALGKAEKSPFVHVTRGKKIRIRFDRRFP